MSVDLDHRCTGIDCSQFGHLSAKNCLCHKSREQVALEFIVVLVEALTDADKYIRDLQADIRDRVYRADELGIVAAWEGVDDFAYDGSAASIEHDMAAAIASATGAA